MIICFADRRGPPPPPSPPHGVDFGCLGRLFQASCVSTGAPLTPPRWKRESVFRETVRCVFGAPFWKMRKELQGAGCAGKKAYPRGCPIVVGSSGSADPEDSIRIPIGNQLGSTQNGADPRYRGFELYPNWILIRFQLEWSRSQVQRMPIGFKLIPSN